MDRKESENFISWKFLIPPTCVSLLLMVIANYNFLAFHLLAEIIPVVIAFTIFSFIWFTDDYSKNSFLLILAMGYFWIAILDLAHAFSFKGMNLIIFDEGNTATQFWIATRYFQAILLLSAPFFIHHSINKLSLFLGLGFISLIIFSTIMLGYFPITLIDGVGFTSFKIYSEYIIIAILIFAIIALFKHNGGIRLYEKKLIAAALVLTVISELAFTIYVDVYGLFNLVGHLFKIYAFWIILLAVVMSNVRKSFLDLIGLKNYNRTLFETSTIGMILSKVDGTLVDYNNSFANIIGRSRQELRTLNILQLTSEKYSDQQAEQLEILDKTGVYGPYIKEYIHKDGHLVPVQLSGKIIELGGKKLIWSSVEDIAEREKLIVSLRENEAYLQSLIEALPDLVWVKDTNGVFLTCNQNFEKMLNLSKSEIIGKKLDAFANKEFAEKITLQESKVLSTKQPVISDDEVTIKVDNKLRLIETIRAPIFSSDGNVVGIIGVGRDFAERKKLEIQAQRNQKMNAVGQLTGGIAHDFNNILAIIIGNLALLGRFLDGNEKATSFLNAARVGADRGALITSKLLNYSRVKPNQIEQVNLNKSIESMAEILTKSLTPSIHIKLELSDNLDNVEIDNSDFDDALLNLAINSRDASSEGGDIVIRTSNKYIDTNNITNEWNIESGNFVNVSIEDTGIGIDESTLGKIFEPFFTTKNIGKGTGLGLSMVYSFMSRSNGFIEIDSEVGKGTKITLNFPTVDEIVPTKKETKSTHQQLPTGSETILIVDDEPNLRIIANEYLTMLGYKTLTAEDANDALQILESHTEIDLLFSDVVMPGGMDGYQLASTALEKYPSMKILLTSGYTNQSADIELENYEILSKPYSQEALASKIRQILD